MALNSMLRFWGTVVVVCRTAGLRPRPFGKERKKPTMLTAIWRASSWLTSCPMRRCQRVRVRSIRLSLAASLDIVEQRLHVLDGGRESERRDGGAVAVEGQHVLPPRRPVTKDEHLASSLGAQFN